MVNDLVSKSREIVNNIWWLIDGFDWIVLDDDPTIAKDSAMRIHGDNHSVVEYNPWVALRFLHYRSLSLAMSLLSLNLQSTMYNSDQALKGSSKTVQVLNKSDKGMTVMSRARGSDFQSSMLFRFFPFLAVNEKKRKEKNKEIEIPALPFSSLPFHRIETMRK